MGELSGNSVLPFNINNSAILITHVGLHLGPKDNAREFQHICYVNGAPYIALSSMYACGESRGENHFRGGQRLRLFNKIKLLSLFCGKPLREKDHELTGPM